MEQLLKQLIGELQTFRSEVNTRLGSLEQGQSEMKVRLDGLEEGQSEMKVRLDGLEEGQSEMKVRLDGLEEGQSEMKVHLGKIEIRLDSLEQGQAEIKEIMKHNFTLQTENFTQIRKDIRIKNQSVQADINLLFEEKEVIKRKVNKIEHSLGI